MLVVSAILFRAIQAVLVVSVGFVTWIFVYGVTSAPFCWNAKDACIALYQAFLGLLAGAWAARRTARWFRREWEVRHQSADENLPSPRRRLLWTLVGGWVGFCTAWLGLLVLAAGAAAFGVRIEEEDGAALVLVTVFAVGSVCGAVLFRRMMRPQTLELGGS
jgi:hypothetical protein